MAASCSFVRSRTGIAVAVAEMNDRSLAVPHDLNLDMARTFDKTLHVQPAVAERAFGLAGCALEGDIEFFSRTRHEHATSATAGRSLHDDGITELFGRVSGVGNCRDMVRTRNSL